MKKSFKTTSLVTTAFWGTVLSISILLSSINTATGLEIGNPGTGITQGNLVIHPILKLKGRYDDNIFLTENDKKDDLIGIIMPGVNIEFPWDNNILMLDFIASLHYFKDHPSENHQDYQLKGMLNLRSSDFSLKIEELFLDTSSRENTDFQERVKRIENSASAALLWSANSFELQGKYKHFLEDYKDDIYRPYDHQEHFGILTGFYRIAPKTKILLEYTYNRIIYNQDWDRDGYYNELRAGLKGEISSKLTATTKVGYQDRRYNDDSVWDDFTGIVGLLTLEYAISRNINLRGGWERTTRESTFGENSYYLLNRGWLAYSQQLAHKIRGYVQIQYSNYRYPKASPTDGTKRKDDVWRPEIGIRYQIQTWLQAQIGYEYRLRDSNRDGGDYKNNRLTLELSATY